MGRRSVRTYVRDFFTNWGRSEEGYGTKLRLTIRNRTLAAVHGFSGKEFCCGHLGEAGC
jgi:hypothetical protein